MSVAAEMVSNYANIRRKFREMKAPEPRPTPSRLIVKQSPSVTWTPAQETDMWLEEDAKPFAVLRITVEAIQLAVCALYQISRTDLLSARRTAGVVRPRQVGMYLARTLTLRSLPEIGRLFGGKDHTTVMHAVGRIEELVATDPDLDEQIQVLKERLRAG